MKTIALLGQSPVQEMFLVVDGTPSPTPRANTKMWTGTSWGTVTGNGAITLCNRIGATLAAAGLDDEVRIYNGGYGGSALLQANAAGTHNFWLGAIYADAPLTMLLAQVAAAGVVPDVVVWWQGWQEYLSSDPLLQNSYFGGLCTLYATLQNAWSKTAAQLPIDIWPSGKAAYPAPATAQSPFVMAAQIAFANGCFGAKLGPSNPDCPTREGTHYTGWAYNEAIGPRGAISLLARLGVPSYENIVMPQITSMGRSGSTLIPWNERDRRAIPAQRLGHAGERGALTGFQLWDMAWAPVPMASCCTMGNQVRIDLAYPTGCHMTYQRGIDQDPSRALYTTIKGVNFMLSPVADPALFCT